MSPVDSLDAAPHRRALALVVRLKEHAHAVLAVELLEDVACAVPGAIVDDDQLLFDGAKIHVEDARDDGADGGLLIVGGHDDRQFHRAGHFSPNATAVLRTFKASFKAFNVQEFTGVLHARRTLEPLNPVEHR